MQKLLLIRHGETAVNRQGKVHKTNDEAPLTPTGILQAEKAAEVCRKESIERVYSSPEIRAQQTACIIADALELPLLIREEFSERNWGEWQIFPWAEIRQRLEKMTLSERYTFIPPQGESWEQMENRLSVGLEKLKHEAYENLALVMHGGAMRAFIPLLLSEHKEKSFEFDPQNGEVMIFNYNGELFSL